MNGYSQGFLRFHYGYIVLILLMPLCLLFQTSCELFGGGGSDDEPAHTGPPAMIDDFEDGDLDLIEQEGRFGRWVPSYFPYPVDSILPDSSIILTIEPGSMLPSYSIVLPGVTYDIISSTKGMHIAGQVANPEGSLVGYVEVLTDISTDLITAVNYDLTYKHLLITCVQLKNVKCL